jgi:hypothetical protein
MPQIVIIYFGAYFMRFAADSANGFSQTTEYITCAAISAIFTLLKED